MRNIIDVAIDVVQLTEIHYKSNYQIVLSGIFNINILQDVCGQMIM